MINSYRAGIGKNLVAGVLLFAVGAAAQAATVTFSNISATDGNNLSGFDASATTPNLNVLDIGVLPFNLISTGVMVDTLLATVTAPAGYRLMSLSFIEAGVYNASLGVIGASTQMLANNVGPTPGFQIFGSSSGGWGPLSQFIDLSASVVTAANVSILNTLFASNGSVAKTSASLSAEIAPIPLPPAAWMLGSALVGLVAVGRRQLGV